MRFKFLIVAGLMLAIMTAGAVCASENVTSDDALALDDSSDIQGAVEEDVLGDSPTADDFEVEFSNTTAVNSEDNVITVYEHTEDGVDGNLTVSVDGAKPVFNKQFKYEEYLKITDLGIDTPGIYALKVNFLPVEGSPVLLLDSKLNVTEREGYGNITAYIYNAAYNSVWDDDVDRGVVNIFDFPSEGRVLVYVDGKLQYNGTSEYITLDNMNEKLSIGRHYVSVRWWNGKNETPIKSRTIHVGYSFGLDEDYDDVFNIGEDARFFILLPGDATGEVYVTFDGKTKKIPHKKGMNYIEYTMKTGSLKPKTYKLKLELKNDPFYPARTFEIDIHMIAQITYHDLAVGETGYVSIYLPKSFKGTLNLYKTKNYVKYGKPIKSVKVKNGRADIALSYSKTGSKYLIAEYVTGKYVDSHSISFDIKKNHKKVSASVSAKTIKADKRVKVKIKGPENFDHVFYIYADNKLVKTRSLKNGKLTVSLGFKTTGTHIIKVLSDNYYGKFFSKSFKIKVKKADVQLSLKKASVKKSAKKITVKATLKIKGKAKKGLKVTFKFNKKKYTAKTNKKGVAKITIKKSALKKLKVGATVKYQASYKKTLVQRTAIVKD